MMYSIHRWVGAEYMYVEDGVYEGDGGGEGVMSKWGELPEC
jgi:hypothetical protein